MRERGTDGLWVLAAGALTAWMSSDPLWALASLGFYAWMSRPVGEADAELARVLAVRERVVAEVEAADAPVPQLLAHTLIQVDALVQDAETLARRAQALGELEERAVGAAPVASVHRARPIERGADRVAVEQLEAAERAVAESAEHRAAIGRGRARARAQLTRIRCTLEAVLAKVLRMKAVLVGGDAGSSAVLSRELENLNAEVTALTGAVAETWGAPEAARTPGERKDA